MNRLASTLVVVAGFLMTALPAMAQRARISPHETISAVIDGNRVTVTYGRPYSKDSRSGEIRKIWGTLVPYDQIWRTGADEATIIITQQPILMGETTIPAGAYTLWTLPAKDGSAKLIINRQIGQWGINPPDPKQVYDEKLDVVRVDLKKEPLDKTVDQFTIAVDRNPSGGGLIKLAWENTQFSAAFTVKK